MTSPTAAGEIAFARSYNSQTSKDGPLGWGWELGLPVDDEDAGYTFLERVTVADGVDFVVVEDLTGQAHYFLNQAGTWTPAPGGEGLALQAPAAAGDPWTLTELDGTVYRFGPDTVEGAYALTSVTRPSTTASGAQLASYTYSGGRLVKVTDRTGHKSFELDYDTAGKLVAIRAPFEANKTLTSFAYSGGRLTEVTDVRSGLKTVYGYDTDGRLASVPPPGVQPVRLAYQQVAGQPPRLSRVERDQTSGATTITAVTTYAYTFAADGTSTTVVRPPRGHAAGDASFDRTYAFDSSSRQTAITTPDGLTATTTWDARNNVVTSQTPAEAAAEAAAKAAGQNGVEFRTVRIHAGDPDAPANCSPSTYGVDLCLVRGPKQDVRQADGTTVQVRPETRYRYDEGLGGVYHLLTTQVEPDGTTTVYQYDAEGLAVRKPNRIVVKDPAGTVLSTRSYRYDNYGRVTEEVAPKGNETGATAADYTTTFSYHPDTDAVQGGYLATVTKPAGQSPALTPTTFTYNVWGQPVSRTDGKGTTDYLYDAAQRPWKTTPPGEATVTTGYEAATGLVASVADVSGTIAYTYDDWGRIVTQTDATGETTNSGYDLHSNPTSKTDRHATTTYTHDVLDRITVVDDPVGQFRYRYAADQTLETTWLPNGITATATSRTATGDLDTLVYRDAAGELGRFDRDYDALGRVTRESRPKSVRDYRYDRLGRLVEAVDRDPATSAVTQTRTYSYDGNSNRTRKTVTDAAGATVSDETSRHDNADRLHDVTGGPNPGPFTYDAAGNTLTTPGRALRWNGANRLAGVDLADGRSVDYALDPLGRTLRRTVKDAAGTVTATAVHHYGLDGDTPTWTEDTAAGAATTTRYVVGADGMTATHTVGGGVSFTLPAPHGDTWATTDATGVVTAISDYDEFGVPRTSGTGGGRYEWLAKQQRETDPDTDLILMGVRAYDPTLGRFLSVDPVHGGSANDYDYANQDPVNTYDLDGEAAFLAAVGVVAISWTPVGWAVVGTLAAATAYQGYRHYAAKKNTGKTYPNKKAAVKAAKKDARNMPNTGASASRADTFTLIASTAKARSYRRGTIVGRNEGVLNDLRVRRS